MGQRFDLLVNGVRRTVETAPNRRLLMVLRNDLDLIGTKYGCGEGVCGACTVLVDGRPTRSCVLPVSEAVGKAITTIEGLATAETLHPVQEAFREVDAMQCGYCTSGMILSAVGLLAAKPNPTDEEILSHMDGNVCRCGTYPRILQAIRLAAERTQGGSR